MAFAVAFSLGFVAGAVTFRKRRRQPWDETDGEEQLGGSEDVLKRDGEDAGQSLR